jgi:predicted ATPase
MILESGLVREQASRYVLTGSLPPLAIPSTLHDSLMARLDRLATARELVQLGAVLGREFAYDLLQAVSSVDEITLQQGLARLVEAELVYQRGLPPRSRYIFKHALIQDAAYQSLLKSTRQQYHQHIAQVLEARFPETVDTQPELLAQHYTAAGCSAQAVGYWQQAGQQALQRSANLEAISHLTTGLELLAMFPETPARAQQELDIQLALGPVLMATKGFAAPEVERTYARARALCTQVGDTPRLFPTLWGLCRFYTNRGALRTARELGEQLCRLAQRTADPTHLLEAHDVLGATLYHMGEYAASRTHFEQGIALADPTMQRTLVLRHDVVPRVRCLVNASVCLWYLGYPAQAMQRVQETLTLAQELSHALSLAFTRYWTANLHYRRREAPAVQAQAEALLTLATAEGFALLVSFGTFLRGWACVMQGQSAAGLAQIRQGLAAAVATGAMLARPTFLIPLAEAAGHAGQVEEGLGLLTEALGVLDQNGQGDGVAEAYRLRGVLLLQQATPEVAQAETCFQQALAVARHQQAKSYELRVAMNLAHLWQEHGKRTEAHALLAPIYGWFTEGFDTKDLQETKALLEALQ